jgi:hypothetical protein
MVRIADEDFTEQIISALGISNKLVVKNSPKDPFYSSSLRFKIFLLEPIESAVRMLICLW